jgi:hypothetical protein
MCTDAYRQALLDELLSTTASSAALLSLWEDGDAGERHVTVRDRKKFIIPNGGGVTASADTDIPRRKDPAAPCRTPSP